MIVLIFGLWTLFVWGGRLRNLAIDPGGFEAASRWSLVGSIVFTVLGLAVVVGWLAVRSALRPALAALVPLTVVVWLIRGVDIAVGDHSVGFIAVHVVLAVVSIGLAALSARTVVDPGRLARPAVG